MYIVAEESLKLYEALRAKICKKQINSMYVCVYIYIYI